MDARRHGDGIAPRRRCIYKAAARAGDGFPDATEAAQAKIFTSEMAIKVTNDALAAVRRGRLFAQSTTRTNGARCAHVHDRRRHRADPAHGRRVAAARPKFATDARRLRTKPRIVVERKRLSGSRWSRPSAISAGYLTTLAATS